MKKLDRIKVWNHSLGGELIEEGIGTLRRKDPSFKGEHIDCFCNRGMQTEKADRKEGKYERWFVTFPNAPKEPYSRWVREEDLVDPFAVANARLGKLAKELSKDPELRKIL